MSSEIGATARRRALVLVNPNARSGGAPLDQALKIFERGGIEVSIEQFASAAEVSPDIVRRRKGIDLVVVCGGDGTVNAAAHGLVETGLPAGILPMGTANDLARTLNIPLNPSEAAAVIVAGHTRRLDVGDVNGHLFFNVASLGLSADIARGLSREAKRRWGRFSYALAAMKALLSARPFGAVIAMKTGDVRVKTLQIAVGNGRHYGGGSIVEASAAIDDGHLDLYSLEVSGVWKLALMLPAFRRGVHGAWREVRTARCTEFEIRTRRPRPINTDGDLVTFTPARFTIRRSAVAMFAPAI
ncbi:MAG: lipid kinase [Alphaproteobacteria bacterium]|nr:lipid kinase [Alphaproteobacteria bacterium]